jgi:hypothetical protein
MPSQPVVLEVDKLRTSAGAEIIFDNIIPSSDSQPGEVLTWIGGATGSFVQSADFALTSYVNSEISGLINGASIGYSTLADIETQVVANSTTITAVIGGASPTHDSLGKIETLLGNIDSNIISIQADISTNTSAISQEQTDRIAADSAIIGGATATFDTLAKIEGEIGTLSTYVDNEVADLKTEILGGASGAYDTLLEIQNELQGNDSDISGILTTMSTKAPIPSVDTGVAEVIAWRSGAWVNDTSFAQTTYVDSSVLAVIGVATSSYDTLGKIEGILTTATADITSLQTDLNTAETDILTKAPLPTIPTSLGDALSWNGTQFVNVTVSTGPPPLTPPVAPTGANEVVQWNGSAFQNVNGYAMTTDLLPIPIAATTGEYISWNGSAWVNSVPAGGGGGTSPSTPTNTDEVLTWDGSNFQNSNAFALKPSSNSLSGQFLQWNGSQFVNTAAPSGGGGGGGGSVSGHIVQVVDNPITGGEALTASDYSTKCGASIVLTQNYSRILVMTAGAPMINGSARLFIHWRSKPSGGAWSAWADSSIVETRLYDKMSWLDLKDSSVGIHYPALTAGDEVEYRVYFDIDVGTIYYPDPAETTSITNMILQEIAP